MGIHCAACKEEIPHYPECAGGRGFVSPISDDVPGSAILSEVMGTGFKGIMGVERQVCMHCFCDEYEQKYPGVECYLREKADFIKADPERAKRFGLLL